MTWEAEPEMHLEPGCRCLCCWEPTGMWQVDSPDSDGPFNIGTKEEAEAMAEYLNELEACPLEMNAAANWTRP